LITGSMGWKNDGWYTAEQLQKIIDTHNRMNEQLRKSMQPIKEKNGEKNNT
jgi:hypothetical protein